ncbi:MAG TPA: Hsp20/alpha crystallin family protein [Phycisphaerae bacterium]|nr:Hsp20/alpha crystallin family protein [Phycisphaerae bacterium]
MALIPWRGRTLPVATLASLREEMNDLLNRFWSSSSEPFGLAEWSPALDVSETDDAVLVHAEIPGIDPKELDIAVVGDTLTIRGEKKDQSEQKGRNYHRVERRYGSFTRSLTLPAAVDADGVTAKAHAGVLQIRLPKKEEAKARRIEIKGE